MYVKDQVESRAIDHLNEIVEHLGFELKNVVEIQVYYE